MTRQAVRPVDVERARADLPVLVDEASRGQTRIVIEEGGAPRAALVSLTDLERLRRLDTEIEENWKILDEIWTRNADKTPEEVAQDVSAAIAEVRAESRREHGR